MMIRPQSILNCIYSAISTPMVFNNLIVSSTLVDNIAILQNINKAITIL